MFEIDQKPVSDLILNVLQNTLDQAPAKLLLEYGHTQGWVSFQIPTFFSLGVIVVIFAIALVYGLLKEQAGRRAALRHAEALRHDASRHKGESL